MSEQIKQMGGGVVKIGEKFEYFNLGNVTIQSLAKNNIIPKKDYGDYNNKRPDGILVDRSNKGRKIRRGSKRNFKDYKKNTGFRFMKK